MTKTREEELRKEMNEMSEKEMAIEQAIVRRRMIEILHQNNDYLKRIMNNVVFFWWLTFLGLIGFGFYALISLA